MRAAARASALRATGGLPPHIVGLLEELLERFASVRSVRLQADGVSPAKAGHYEQMKHALAFRQTPGGPSYVFDRRAHAVYPVEADKTSARQRRRC